MRKILIILTLCIAAKASYSCSGVNKTVGDKTLFGGNFDWMNPYTKVLFVPGEGGKNGVVYMALEDGPCTGINDKGLAMDHFSTPYREVKYSSEKEDLNDSIFKRILEECSTVDEAISLIEKYNRWFLEIGQLMIVDKFGKSVIVEANNIVEKESDFQIVTNFNQSEYINKEYPCDRYNKALKMIDEINFNVKGLESVLNAIKQDKYSMYPTLYSYIFDLEKGEINLYNFGDFNNKVIFNIEEELKKGYRSISISSLLRNQEYEMYLAKYMYKKPTRINIETNIDEYTGSYQFEWGEVFKIGAESNKLYTGDKNIKYELIPYRKDSFFYEKLDYILFFKRNKSGDIIEVTYYHTFFASGTANKIN